MKPDLHTRIRALLEGSSIPFDHFEHEYVHTSHEAARARGTNIEDAAKALVFETGSVNACPRDCGFAEGRAVGSGK
jgi:hypothetical protein